MPDSWSSLTIAALSWKLIKNAERRLAAEIALVRPEAGGDVRVALGYPNTYHVGMSNLGLQLIYGFLNRMPGVTCERFFLPDPEEMSEYRKSGRRLFTLESQRPVGEFDIVGFTCSYEVDYVNLVTLIEMSGLAIFARDRAEHDPLVVVGGAITFLNPEPVADFVDVFCVGEGEGLVEQLVEGLRGSRGLPREERLAALCSIAGLYVPRFYEPRYQEGVLAGLEPVNSAPERVSKHYLSRDEFAGQDTHSLVLTPDCEFGVSFLMEVSRGCPYICRFCTVGFSYPKVRWKPVEHLWSAIERVAEHRPKVGLISATVGNHPEIRELCRRLMSADLQVSFSSLRADQLPDEMIEAISKSGSKTITLAPETGSEALRKSINKRFSDDCYYNAAERVFGHGIKNLRMYSMVGLPNELEADGEALVEMVKRTRALQRKAGQAGGRITLSLGLFVPKPLTPYQWNPQLSMEEAAARMNSIKKSLAGLGGVRVNAESPKVATLEGLLSRADRRMARVIARVYKNPKFSAWKKALKAEGLSFEQENYRHREGEAWLPWSHIQASWPRERLLKDAVRAKDQRFKS